ncbi:MAG: inorganic phosphate transporter, partial [Alphaproteobacteria bacterium]|nr:inorganic phosphate transporter [Alphaproteobacteria bacterium]
MDIIQQHGTLFIGLAVIFGLYMTWGIGANDVANVMGTSVGSGAITVRTAIIIAAIFEFAGAAIAGGHVTDTIRKGMIDADAVTGNPEV